MLLVLTSAALERELAVALKLARAAGAEALNIRRQGRLHAGVKANEEPVTAADRVASAMIVRGLLDAFPHDAVMSEELEGTHDKLAAERLWVIDPIDGTRDFIDGSDGFAVMIGLMVHSLPVVGVVHLPAQARTYWAGPDGAFTFRDGVSTTLAVSTVSSASRARFVVSKSHRPQLVDRLKSALGIVDELAIPSIGAKMGLIAAGARDLYVHGPGVTKIWDVCAPHAILSRAGGKLTDLSGSPLSYSRGLINARGLLATNGYLHGALVEALAPIVVDLGF